jgi:hypothetical protein
MIRQISERTRASQKYTAGILSALASITSWPKRWLAGLNAETTR